MSKFTKKIVQVAEFKEQVANFLETIKVGNEAMQFYVKGHVAKDHTYGLEVVAEEGFEFDNGNGTSQYMATSQQAVSCLTILSKAEYEDVSSYAKAVLHDLKEKGFTIINNARIKDGYVFSDYSLSHSA